jgi:multicomponent Na+:H+ antiporter subunit D
MQNLLLVLPIIIPLAIAAIQILAWHSCRAQRWLSLLGSTALLVVAGLLLATVWRDGIQATQLGDWPAPYGITLVADLFSATMVVVAALMGFAVIIYSLSGLGIDPARESFGYYPLLNILLMGVSGVFLTGDIFNMYVWFEVMLISSFVLLALGGERTQLEGALKYVTINLVSSAVFLTAVGVLYGVVGTLNLADLAIKLNDTANPGLVTTLAMLFLITFGIKAAIFPLFFWLPESYHTPPVAVSAIFAGLLTKVGVYALIRVFTLLFTQNVGYTHTLILVLSGFTMVVGVLGAAAQYEFRKVLSFHIISQIGYMIMGLGLFTPLAIAGSIFFIVHNIFAKANLFLISGAVERLRGTYELKELGGLYRAYPGLSILFLIPALSLAGIPPLSGFWAKYTLARAGLEVEQYVIVAAALLVGLLTLFSMTKIWNEAFWKPLPTASEGLVAGAAANQNPGRMRVLLLPIIMLAVLTVLIGLLAEPVLLLAMAASEQLLQPSEYIEAVMGA